MTKQFIFNSLLIVYIIAQNKIPTQPLKIGSKFPQPFFMSFPDRFGFRNSCPSGRPPGPEPHLGIS